MELTNYTLKLKKKLLLNDLTIRFDTGVISHILGKNGVGKSVFGKDLILNFSRKVPQSILNEIVLISSSTNLPLDLNLDDILKLVDSKALEQVLNLGNIDPKMKIKYLSDGQKQKIKLLYFLSFDQSIIVLDEITNAIDKQSTLEIYKFLREFIIKNPSKVLINITHNLSDLSNLAGNYFVFDEQTIKQMPSAEIAIKHYVEG
ncbi:MAG: ATP-binding cassette domain-containing protein [Streptococcaceae bacterium]|nr:ATP-binding cassette domain-containing protein [Streptococcaceae bacterium]